MVTGFKINHNAWFFCFIIKFVCRYRSAWCMLIRKLFKFENAHIVRNCTSDRCKRSIHGHSYKVELLLKASKLDHGQMVYDFGLLKGVIKELFDSFDHAICYWQKDDPEYIAACQTFSARWIAFLFRHLLSNFHGFSFIWHSRCFIQPLPKMVRVM